MEMKTYVRRTARAFQPRWQLAEFERESGNRREELRLLLECNQIDPFYRELHVRLGEAYEALEQPAKAAVEFEVAAAVQPSADRKYMPRDQQPPADDSPEELQARGALWIRAAKLRHRLGDQEKRDELLERAQKQVPGTDAANEARELQQEWRGR